jgi:hypothetical protein
MPGIVHAATSQPQAPPPRPPVVSSRALSIDTPERRHDAAAIRGFAMTLCPIALAVGCKKCPAFSICPLKTVIGDQKKIPEATSTRTSHVTDRDPKQGG